MKAGSIFYAIVIALIIALLCSSLILLAYFNRIQIQQYFVMEKVLLNTSSGIKILLSDQELVAFNEKIILDLFNEGNDSVLLERKHWGAFEIAISQGFSGKIRNVQIAQVGFGFYNDENFSLYLSDQKKPLSLCGKTTIKGTCYLPKAGVKRAYIEGQSFIGNVLIEGEIRESSKTIPEINNELIKFIEQYLYGEFEKNDDVIDFNESNPKDSLSRSFSKTALFLYNEEKIILTDQHYSGHIGIVSEKAIYIGSETQLEDIIVYAPEVIVEEGFKGNLQIFASDSIIIEKNCLLEYPSVLGLIRTEISTDNPALVINAGTNITGILFAYEKNPGGRKYVSIKIAKDAFVEGQVYCSGLVDLQGKIHGNLICNKFILSTPSSVYENHLLNATIDITELSGHFVGIELVNHSVLPGNKKKIVKWLF